jgi:serine/threonine protein kinase
MELADKGSLDSRITKQQRVTELEVLDVGIKVASALDAALKHNLLHLDIKPGNILFNADGEPKLVDFGLARKVEADVSQEQAAWGTPYYVAPEKIKREPETFLSDMYSLGGTLYHALTGHVPFEAPTVDEVVAAHVHTPLTPPNQVVPEITQPTSDALQRALAGDFKRFLERVAKIQSGLLICVYCLSFAPALLYLEIPGESASGKARLLFFFVMMALLAEAFQFVWSQLYGRHVIAPAINASRTWEGLVGGSASNTSPVIRGSMTIASAESSRRTTRLPSRSTSVTCRPMARRRKASIRGAIRIGRLAQRGRWTSRMRQPAMHATPRRMVSTSGSSGIGEVRRAKD